MELALFIMAIVTLVYLIFTMIEFKIGFKKIVRLTTQPLLPPEQLPAVSIIFSALNEEVSLRNSLQSMLNINYPSLEIIAVNDRSTDKTPIILDEFKNHPFFTAHHIDKLSKGWLGKNHALHVASQTAKGDWILFTDADILMKSDTISKAMSYAIENNLDHLTIYENHTGSDFWLKILLLGSYISYSMAMRPWRIRFPWSKKSLGHGAFNLVKKSSYLKAGGHQAIAMECLDDLKLGEIIKKNGFKQDTVDGRDYIEREWYTSFSDMVKGFQKNAFAYFNYQFLAFLRDFLLCLFFYIWPLIAVFIFTGLLQWVNFANILITIYMTIDVAKHFRLPKWYAIFYPFGISALLYAIWNSVISTYKHNGVIWRDTYYSLQELRYKK